MDDLTFGNLDQAEPSDCAIVLGAAVYGSKPSPVFEERIRHAIHLHQTRQVSKLIFTGAFGQGVSHAESQVGAAYAVLAGVPATDVLTETLSHTTHQNLVEARRVMKQHSLQTAIIVSDPLHLKRASVMAGDMGLDAVTSPTPTSRYQS